MKNLNCVIEEAEKLLDPELSMLALEYENNYLLWETDFHKANPGIKIKQGSKLINMTQKFSEYWKIMDVEKDVIKQKHIYETWLYSEFYEYYYLWLAKNYKQYIKAK